MKKSKLSLLLTIVLAVSVAIPAKSFGQEGNDSISRADLVMRLYQLAGEPSVAGTSPFSDVADSAAYADAVAWAAQNGVVSGIGNSKFSPETEVTREQTAVMFLNYAKLAGGGPVGSWVIRMDYKDLSDISDWAFQAVMFSKIHSFLPEKTDNRFIPKGSLTDSEANDSVKRLAEYVQTIDARNLQDETGETSAGTNYSDKNNWLALPTETTHDADVIYFYPTAYSPDSDEDPDICDIDDEGMRSGAKDYLLCQGSAFETSGDIYAPYYRQLNAMALAGKTQQEMIEAESGEPREDVFAALDYYFENCNNGRPYFLAGHSQGGMMIYIILQEYMAEHPEYYENMIAAYMLGNAPTKEWLAQNPHVKMAQGADDTGVLISWNTEGPGNDGKYNMVVPDGSVCINPLNWSTDGTPAGIEENKGSLISDGNGGYKLVEGFADARIDVSRGSVICDSVDPAEYAIPKEAEALFGPESYHGWDYGFYYQNIRENAELRLERFLKGQGFIS